MRTLLTLAALLLPSAALAGGHEVNLEVGLLETPTELAGNNLTRSFGLSGGYAVLEDVHKLGLLVRGSYHRSLTGRGLFSSSDTDEDVDDVYYYDTTGAHMALVGDQFSVGAKLDVSIGEVMYPYVAVDGLVHLASARFDSNRYSDDNQNQIAAKGVGGGVRLTGGLDLTLPRLDLGWRVAPALFVELGYAAMTNPQLDGIGPVEVGGFLLRSGVGIRF